MKPIYPLKKASKKPIKSPKFKVGDWLRIVSSGECCGDNTPSDHGYSWDLEDGRPDYPNLVEVVLVHHGRESWYEPLYRIRYTYGECNIYEDGLDFPVDELGRIVAQIKKEINETVK